MEIRRDDLESPIVHALLEEHLRDMHAWSPACSVHALDLDGLKRPEVTFWTAWAGDDLLGCGALKAIDATHAEIKSMRTAHAHRRKGVAQAMLVHLMDHARARGFTRLSLETGAQVAFEPARQLYARHGFRDCPAFEGYAPDPNSVFMTREL
jgi:putative acetyltransferase